MRTGIRRTARLTAGNAMQLSVTEPVAVLSRILNRIAKPLKPRGNIVCVVLHDQTKLYYEQIFTFRIAGDAAT